MSSRHDARGVFLHASPAAQALLGELPARLIGTSLQAWVEPEHGPRIEQAMALAAKVEDAVVTTCRLRRADEARWVEVTMHAVRVGEAVELHCVTRGVAEPGSEAQPEPDHVERMRRLEALLTNVPGIVWASWGLDASKEQASYINDNVLPMTGYTQEEWRAQPMLWFELIHPEDRERVKVSMGALMAEGQQVMHYRWIRRDGAVLWIEARTRVLRDATGNMTGMCGVNLDITPQKEAEAAEARLRDEVIATQQRILADLSMPLIPLGDRVVVMPLIGTLDALRAERVVDALLHGVSSSAARVAIVDITGVPTVDTKIADTLVRAARGVRLLGAQVILTGIRPEVAQTLVSLGTELGDIVTLGNLEAGIRFAMQRPG